MRRLLPPLLLAFLALAGGKREDMYSQGKSDTWDRSRFFAKQQSMQKPVPARSRATS